jgi:hypothetical protein
MTLNQIKENELYFTKVLDTLGEGGVFFFKNVLEVLKKRQGFFECSKKAYLEVEKIVSQDFLHKYFKIKENEKTQNEKSGLDYFWEEISNKYLDSYQKELFTQIYKKAKLIEKEKLIENETNIKIDINQK